jgi:hypothetical protein
MEEIRENGQKRARTPKARSRSMVRRAQIRLRENLIYVVYPPVFINSSVVTDRSLTFYLARPRRTIRATHAHQNSYRTRGRLYRWNGARSDVGQSDLSARGLCRSRIFRRGQLPGSWAGQFSGGSQRFLVRLLRHYYQSCIFSPDLCSRGQSQPPLHRRGRANLPDYWRVSVNRKHPPGIPTTLATFRSTPRVV